ncbi:MAG TPA: SatD family protein [Glaciihabitans sp.]|jgi:hypothetical protein|nr:SatD family protein [Glaciihabitans sp.]
MIVVTADQIDSTHRTDLAGSTVDRLNDRYADSLALPVDRNAGDEIQAIVQDPRVALTIILDLLRTNQWSVGCGIGAVRTPLPANTREASGPAFVAARAAVIRAKKEQHRFSLVIDEAHEPAHNIAPLMDLLLFVRSRRSDEGWQLYDLLEQGLTQADAAARLGITPQAASQRARAAGIRIELSAHAPLAQLIGEADTAQ